MGIKARFGAALNIVGLPITAQGNQQHGFAPGLRPDEPTRLIPIYAGHTDVENNNLWPQPFGGFYARLPVEAGVGFVAGQFEQQGQRGGRIPIVIYNQHPAFG